MPLSDEKGGPRPVEIDYDALRKLCGIQCTEAEAAAYLGVHVNTLAAAIQRDHGKTWKEYFEENRGAGLISLRRRQYERAMEGNPTMLIWLGKNWLGQTDQVQVQGDISFTGFRVVEAPDGDT